MKPREPRKSVWIPSRMQADRVWVDVCIHNISSRGLLVQTEQPPQPGTYIDIRRGTQIIIGRAVWRRDKFFGVRTQERLNIDSIINEPRLTSRPTVASADADGPERRTPARAITQADIAARAESSRRFAAAFQFCLILAGCAAAATFCAYEVKQILSAPMNAAGAAMAGRP